MTITTAFILIFFTVPFLKAKKTNSVSDLYPTRMQVAAELGFNFINSLLIDIDTSRIVVITSPSKKIGTFVEIVL